MDGACRSPWPLGHGELLIFCDYKKAAAPSNPHDA
jgi:hypothetical protein